MSQTQTCPYCTAHRGIRPVTTRPSNRKTTLRQSGKEYQYSWLIYREIPDGFWRIILSDAAVPGWEAAGTVVRLQKPDGTCYHCWEIKAVMTGGALVSGHADLDQKYALHEAESRQ